MNSSLCLSLVLSVISVLVSCLRFLLPFSLVLFSRVPFIILSPLSNTMMLTQLGSFFCCFCFLQKDVTQLAEQQARCPPDSAEIVRQTGKADAQRADESAQTAPPLLSLSLSLSEL